jgi:hypothetical protein
VSTFTARLGLEKPATSDLYDIGVPNANMDKLDRVGGTTICTSGTRPNSPFLGMTAYETDTKNTVVWNGSTWLSTPEPPQNALIIVCTSGTRPSSPTTGQLIYETDTKYERYWDGATWQIIGPTDPTPGAVCGNLYNGSNATLSTITNNTTEQLSGMSCPSFAPNPNSIYRITAKAEYDDVAGGLLTWRIRLGSTTGGTQIGTERTRAQVVAATRQHVTIQAVFSTGASPTTQGAVLTVQRDATNATVPHLYKSLSTIPFMMAEYLGKNTAWATI